MASTSQEPKGRDGVRSALGLAIQALNLAKDACGIPPAQVAFATASVLLAMIRVSFPLCTVQRCISDLRCLGHYGQRPGLRRPWEVLRRCVPGPLPETEG